jgi:hypothetical protein
MVLPTGTAVSTEDIARMGGLIRAMIDHAPELSRRLGAPAEGHLA